MNHLHTKTCKYRDQLWKERNGHKTTLTDSKLSFSPRCDWTQTPWGQIQQSSSPPLVNVFPSLPSSAFPFDSVEHNTGPSLFSRSVLLSRRKSKELTPIFSSCCRSRTKVEGPCDSFLIIGRAVAMVTVSFRSEVVFLWSFLNKNPRHSQNSFNALTHKAAPRSRCCLGVNVRGRRRGGVNRRNAALRAYLNGWKKSFKASGWQNMFYIWIPTPLRRGQEDPHCVGVGYGPVYFLRWERSRLGKENASVMLLFFFLFTCSSSSSLYADPSVGSHFHVWAEIFSPSLSTVISLLALNRQSSAAVHVFSTSHTSFSFLFFSPLSSHWVRPVLIPALGPADASIGL